MNFQRLHIVEMRKSAFNNKTSGGQLMAVSWQVVPSVRIGTGGRMDTLSQRVTKNFLGCLSLFLARIAFWKAICGPTARAEARVGKTALRALAGGLEGGDVIRIWLKWEG